MLRLSMKFGSVHSVVAEIGRLSPVRTERSNLRSPEHCRSRKSAGHLLPKLTYTISPTRSAVLRSLSLTDDKFRGGNAFLVTITQNKRVLRNHAGDRGHNL